MSNFSQRPPPFGLLSFPNPQQGTGYMPPAAPWDANDPQQQQQQVGYQYPPTQFGNFPPNFNSRQRNDTLMNDMGFKEQQLYNNRPYHDMMPNAPKYQQNNRIQPVYGVNHDGLQHHPTLQLPEAPPMPYYQYGRPQDNRYVGWTAPRQQVYPTIPPQQIGPSAQQIHYEAQNQQYMPYPDAPQNCNVYIKGLPPEMTDKKLYEICSLYGKVVSSKCIINNSTNICKGFGFALYADPAQTLSAIEGLNKLPYHASLARSTRPFCFYKPGTDPNDLYHNQNVPTFDPPQNGNQYSEAASTNVYICNLPPNMDEAALQHLFSSFNVVSVRVLKNSSGFSRGVGFVRFANHSQAQAAIDAYNGQPVPQYQGYDGVPCNVLSSTLCLRFAREKPHH